MLANVLGIDTGLGGGLSLCGGAGHLLRVWPTPTKRVEGRERIDWAGLSRVLGEIAGGGQCEVALEQVRAFAKRSGGSTFVMASTSTMLENSGVYKYLLAEAGLPVSLYFPEEWQRSYRDAIKAAENLQSEAPTADVGVARRVMNRNARKKIATGEVAHAFWPVAGERFGKDWNSGTWEAALIARHHALALRERNEKG